jgi:transcriptional regulator NrdR family protein
MVFNIKSATTKVREQLFKPSIIMAETVIKKDGTEQPFAEQKIRDSISAALRESGVPEEEGDEIVEKITKAVLEYGKDQDELATSEIRDKILAELEEEEPEAAKAWRNYEMNKSQGEGGEEEKEEEKEGGEEEENGGNDTDNV